MPLIGVAHGDPIVGERLELLDQPMVQLLGPLAGQEADDCRSTRGELRAVSPAAVGRIGKSDLFWIPAVPAVFCQEMRAGDELSPAQAPRQPADHEGTHSLAATGTSVRGTASEGGVPVLAA
jgi:hypothetical protein